MTAIIVSIYLVSVFLSLIQTMRLHNEKDDANFWWLIIIPIINTITAISLFRDFHNRHKTTTPPTQPKPITWDDVKFNERESY